MTYSYAKRSFPRRGPRRQGGGAAGWVAVLVLVIAIGALWWTKSGRTAGDTPIISSPAAINNPSSTIPAPAETEPEEAGSMTLTLKGLTAWGVQRGAFSTDEAARAAAEAHTVVLFSGQRYRVIDSLWPDRERAVTYRQGLEGDSYVTELSSPSVNLKLSGSREKLDAVSRAAEAWEEGLAALLEAQAGLDTGDDSAEKARAEAQRVREALSAARTAVPDETEVLRGMRDALEESVAALDEILAENAGKEVDFVMIFRYNVLICYNIYNTYAVNLISSS